jgi:hypothetical protein
VRVCVYRAPWNMYHDCTYTATLECVCVCVRPTRRCVAAYRAQWNMHYNCTYTATLECVCVCVRPTSARAPDTHVCRAPDTHMCRTWSSIAHDGMVRSCSLSRGARAEPADSGQTSDPPRAPTARLARPETASECRWRQPPGRAGDSRPDGLTRVGPHRDRDQPAHRRHGGHGDVTRGRDQRPGRLSRSFPLLGVSRCQGPYGVRQGPRALSDPALFPQGVDSTP